MITNVSLVTVWVTDQDAAKAFYVDVLGFAEQVDMTLGDGYRWLTVVHPDHPELELTLMVPGPSGEDGLGDAIRAALAAGTKDGIGLRTDDCRAEAERLRGLGVRFVQEPADRPYGVEAVFLDVAGNRNVLVERRAFTGEDFPHS